MNKIAKIIFALAVFFTACSPEARWTTGDVTINMTVTTVSAGFIECSFSTNKDAYYLIAIEEARDGYDPMEHQKQFMTLALDSANVDYLVWRNSLLKQGEFTIAPFASHSLQYGKIDYFFTGLLPGQDYWVYAFVVNPQTLQPVGKLYLEKVRTTDQSIMDIYFEYRVKGYWDYIYPVDSLGNIYSRFPYISTTRDSIHLEETGITDTLDVITYFVGWMLERFLDPSLANVMYGVKAIENDGWQSAEAFQEGHTYYTAIAGYDGSLKHTAIYKFTWTGDSCQLYFHDTDSTNMASFMRDF